MKKEYKINIFSNLFRPFHELVYAKQKGFPYWPAKVMCSKDNTSEVRFFGGYHQKAIVEKGNMKPISVNIHTLQVICQSSRTTFLGWLGNAEIPFLISTG